MNNLKEKYREAAEKRPILLSTLSYSGLALVIAGAAVIVFVFVLNAFGVYGNLETALDLKHNSVVILGPMLLLALLASLSLLGGVLMYFHKYKRPKVNTAFRDAVAPALGMETGKKG